MKRFMIILIFVLLASVNFAFSAEKAGNENVISKLEKSQIESCDIMYVKLSEMVSDILSMDAYQYYHRCDFRIDVIDVIDQHFGWGAGTCNCPIIRRMKIEYPESDKLYIASITYTDGTVIRPLHSTQWEIEDLNRIVGKCMINSDPIHLINSDFRFVYAPRTLQYRWY